MTIQKTIRGYYKKYIIHRHMTPAQILVFGFFLVISTGTLLLMLPISSNDGRFTDPLTCAFTSVSATCVTGLVVKDTEIYWSGFGQTVILAMIQIGGLGFMSMAALFSMLIKRKITPRERLILIQSFGVNSDEGAIKLVKRILKGTLIMELSGAAMLSTQFIPIFGVRDGIGKSIFHSVSAFCNAGFDIFGKYSGAYSSLAEFRGNYVVNITIMTLIIVGGIGFIIWDDIFNLIINKRHISVYSRFVLIITAILIFGGALLILFFEWNNEATFKNLPVGEKVMASFFQSVTTRTAGFSSVDNTQLTELSKIVSIILMFIGGASGSTAGGVKVGTFGLLIYTAISVAMGSGEVVLFKRKISNDNILRAFAVVSYSLIATLICSMIIAAVDGVPFLSAIFETVSAGATVGLTLSLTPTLSSVSQIILMLLMFFGRVGILTITYSIMTRFMSEKSNISYCETQMLIG